MGGVKRVAHRIKKKKTGNKEIKIYVLLVLSGTLADTGISKDIYNSLV